MSFEDGWAALNLEMPARVPRTEYSIEGHWEVLKVVTGIDVDVDSPGEVKKRARDIFVGPEGWNQPFTLDVTNEIVWNAENQITVRVLDSKFAGGIWKPVIVEALK